MLTILVADDEPAVQSFFRAVVERESLPVAQVLEASDGLEAVALAIAKCPDLIFLDIRMPKMSGLVACSKIKAEYPDAVIYIISAYGEFDYAKEALKAGVRDYLLKPVRPAQLAEIIKQRAAELPVPQAQPARAEAPLITAVKQYVQEHLDEPLPLDIIAKNVFISPSHLSRRFKDLTGESLTDFIKNTRLDTGAELLRNTRLSITEVAGSAGFTNLSYFSTCFKERFGVSPQSYRKDSE